MRKKLTILFCSLLGAACSIAQTNVIHLNLGSHNEMSDPAHGVNYQTNYAAIKALALAVADSVNANNAKWNMQVESNFIRACLQFDNANSTSNDLMEYMDNLSYVEVDPHNHLDTVSTSLGFNPYNYADLNHLLDSCGLSTRTNVGGFIYTASDWETWDANWTLWKDGLQGRTFPNEVWTPVVLWGGGTPNHTNDINPIGVWHPGGATPTSFLTNNSAQLLDLGNGCAWLIKDTTVISDLLQKINDFVDAVNATPATSNTFYSATIMFDFRSILSTGYVAKIAEVLRGLKPLADNNKIVWQTLSEKRADWLSTHNNTTDSFIKVCDDVSIGLSVDTPEKASFQMYPNPAVDLMHLDFSSSSFAGSTIRVTDLLGHTVYSIQYDETPTMVDLDLSLLSSGMYVLSVVSDEEFVTKKFIVE